jgi:hypothetical protein
MANRPHITIPLSALTADPVLRAFFERAERDLGSALIEVEPAPRAPHDGAAAVLEMAEA